MGWDKMLIGSLFGSPIPRTGLWFGWPTETDLPMAEAQEFLYEEMVPWSCTMLMAPSYGETNTTSTDARMAELLDTGNLVIKGPGGEILWQSFDSPTDTLLPNQLFTKSTKLIARLHGGIYWPVPYLKMFENGRTNYNGSRIAVYDEMGHFVSSDWFQFIASDMGLLRIKRRLTMDHDGNLRLYSLNNDTGLWVISWEALTQLCTVHGVCGRNAICVNTPEPKCSCPPGYEITEPGNWNQGCKPLFNEILFQSQQVKFVELPHVDYFGFDLNFIESISIDSCMKLCVGDYRCKAFNYKLTGERRCYTKSELFNGYQSPSFEGKIYLKLPVTVETSQLAILNGTDPICQSDELETMIGSPSMYNINTKRMRWVYLYSFASAIGFIELLFVVSEGGEEDESDLTGFVRMVKSKIQCGEDSWIEEIVDPRLNGQFSRNQATTIVQLGISCVEEDRNKRPTMDLAIQALLECQD
ncbi:hypothetical protein H0E87_009525 [Populus deltoides]|uniref:non-specific serine/threonine protein kinase n=1 Tax=Populus deltoides TaxID=3696 RepID=A0A8T2YPA9_POPDE|nr:hypothetical protein H0E87_009525 [Populus deltoides]